jgi:hypothetical protein
VTGNLGFRWTRETQIPRVARDYKLMTSSDGERCSIGQPGVAVPTSANATGFFGW